MDRSRSTGDVLTGLPSERTRRSASLAQSLSGRPQLLLGARTELPHAPIKERLCFASLLLWEVDDGGDDPASASQKRCGVPAGIAVDKQTPALRAATALAERSSDTGMPYSATQAAVFPSGSPKCSSRTVRLRSPPPIHQE